MCLLIYINGGEVGKWNGLANDYCRKCFLADLSGGPGRSLSSAEDFPVQVRLHQFC